MNRENTNLEQSAVERRIDRYVRDYSARTLAETIVELENLYAPISVAFARLRISAKTKRTKTTKQTDLPLVSDDHQETMRRKNIEATPPSPSSEPRYFTIVTAAPLLDTVPDALRALCRREAKLAGNSERVELGGGVVAFKFGANWRIIFQSNTRSAS